MKKWLLLILILFIFHSCRTITIKEIIKYDTDEDWYFAGGNPGKTFISNSSLILNPPFKEFWSYNTEAGYSKNSISVCDGIIFTSNLKGDVFAMDIYTGNRMGSFGTKGKASYSTPLIYKNFVIVTCTGSEENSILCYNYKNGIIKWERDIGDIYGSPILIDDFLYVSTYKGNIYKINVTDGFTEWDINSKNKSEKLKSFFTGPSATDKLILAGNSNGKLYAVDMNNGEIKWSFLTDSQIYCDAAFYNHKIYFGADDKNFYCLDTNGIIIWKKEMKTKFQSSPSFYNNLVIIPGIDGLIYALNDSTGNENWIFETNGTVWASPLVHKDLIFIGSFDNYFYCLNAEDGKLKWKYLLDGRIRTSAVTWKDYIVVGCDDKEIYCFK